jgi:hypothetical protein
VRGVFNSLFVVMPAKAGIQESRTVACPGPALAQGDKRDRAVGILWRRISCAAPFRFSCPPLLPPDSTLSGGGRYVVSIAIPHPASEEIRVMITSQILFEFFGRLAPTRYPHRLEDRPESALRRLQSTVRRRLRQHPPPPLSAHLCRDIGIDPPPKSQERPWPW